MGAEEEDEEAKEGEDGDDVDELLGPLRRRERQRDTVRLCRFVFDVVVAIVIVSVSLLWLLDYESVVLGCTAMAVELGDWGAQRLSLHDGV